MRGFHILVLLILALPCMSNAQPFFDAKEGCLNVIDFSFGQGMGEYSDNCVAVNYMHEVFVNEQFCVGGGIGYSHRARYDFSAIPVYLSMHYFLLDRRFSPFASLRIGAFGMFGKKNVDTLQRYSISSKSQDFNLYVSPSIGFKAHITPNFGVMASVSDDAYLVKTYDTAKTDYRSKLLHCLGISVGICFQIKGW